MYFAARRERLSEDVVNACPIYMPLESVEVPGNVKSLILTFSSNFAVPVVEIEGFPIMHIAHASESFVCIYHIAVNSCLELDKSSKQCQDIRGESEILTTPTGRMLMSRSALLSDAASSAVRSSTRASRRREFFAFDNALRTLAMSSLLAKGLGR